ncbi:hypothetical protein ACQKPE_24660 [Pseudomonas sp. NPDC089554]|uniref:hypothetical protein n=1 Tax=Pseudomonas sp. NPDC089554 TaxID=3390653 RepID=UPI003CFD4EE2
MDKSLSDIGRGAVPLRRVLKRVAFSIAGLVLAAAGFFSWQSFYPVQAANGWSYRVLHEQVPKAASLAMLSDGAILVSQELREGRGSIVRIDGPGERHEVLGGLSKPDGLIAARGGWVFSQEVADKPVMFLDDGVVTPLFEGSGVQGLWDDGENLYAIEDRKHIGRLLRYNWQSQSVTVVRDNLDEAESITRCPDGRMLYTKKAQGVVRVLAQDRSDPVLIGGLNQPTFLRCDERGLWINEDSTHRARLLLITPQGKQQTILSFLKAPQAVIATGNGSYLVAEGGRDRVLELTPSDSTPR